LWEVNPKTESASARGAGARWDSRADLSCFDSFRTRVSRRRGNRETHLLCRYGHNWPSNLRIWMTIVSTMGNRSRALERGGPRSERLRRRVEVEASIFQYRTGVEIGPYPQRHGVSRLPPEPSALRLREGASLPGFGLGCGIGGEVGRVSCGNFWKVGAGGRALALLRPLDSGPCLQHSGVLSRIGTRPTHRSAAAFAILGRPYRPEGVGGSGLGGVFSRASSTRRTGPLLVERTGRWRLVVSGASLEGCRPTWCGGLPLVARTFYLPAAFRTGVSARASALR
jgi:hypothetical protein